MGQTARPARPENRKRIRELCRSYGISIAEAARILDRKDNTLHRMMTENFERPPPDELVELLEYRLLKRYGKAQEQKAREQETA